MEMSDRSYRRLTRYALFAAVSVPFVLMALLSPVVSLVFLVVTLPIFYLAIGPYQADVALNPNLDESGRRWWRIALFLFPPVMVLYWHRYVRGGFVD
jgi:hypothetical protein